MMRDMLTIIQFLRTEKKVRLKYIFFLGFLNLIIWEHIWYPYWINLLFLKPSAKINVCVCAYSLDFFSGSLDLQGLIPKKNGQRTSVVGSWVRVTYSYWLSWQQHAWRNAAEVCLRYITEEEILELPYAAGHYVPQLAELVYERNKDKKEKSYINLKGFIVRIWIRFYDAQFSFYSV